MNATFEELIADIAVKAEARADAKNHESELEDNRALVKKEAIQRIVERDKIAATPAEKIVETDEGYAAHRAAQRAAVIAVFQTEAAYKAAVLNATRAAAITPEMAELVAANHSLLRSRNEALERVSDLDIDNEKLAGINEEHARLIAALNEKLRLGDITLRRTNGWLADRIRDVEGLTAANRDLSAKFDREHRDLEEALRTIDALEHRIDTGTAAERVP